VIPHAFGRRVPPVIDTLELLTKKYEMLNVLGDIEIAQNMQKADTSKASKLAPHPADANYATLGATLDFVDPKSDEFEMIQKYIDATAADHRERFAKHAKLDNRKLLWHGTNVAVVAAICKTGLRIMPHSGGRVGKGIYTASENGKSINYMGWSGKDGVMFLAEVALGKEHGITRDDSSLKAAPKGFDSIVARGRTEPDPKKDTTFKYDGNNVVVPQGKPIAVKEYSKSSFTQSEYLVYQESQIRLRYAVQVKI
jgi:poly [ADP-ribose] polymerase